MNQLKRLLSTSLILISLIPLTVRAEKESPPPEKPKQSTSIFRAVLSLFKTSERRMMTRGDEVCLISPGNGAEQLIWSDRPLFIWWGEISESQINLYRQEQLIWTETVPANSQTIAYSGAALEPGVKYDWELVANGRNYRQTIVLLEQSQQKAIAAELASLNRQLKTNKATIEAIAIARAEYFLDQELSSDALQQLYLVKNPSPELTAQIANFEDRLCK
ncbi:MAG: hypothetical protein AAFY63_14165 [Cyanobacteria bacterium J06643_13]